MMYYSVYNEVQMRREEIRQERIAAEARRGELAAAVGRMLRPRPSRRSVTRRLAAQQYTGG